MERLNGDMLMELKKYTYPNAIVVHKRYPDIQELKNLVDAEIETLKRNGFNLAICENEENPWLNDIYRLFTDEKVSDHVIPGFRLSDNFNLVRKFSLSGTDNSFIHVLPYDFTFTYVDKDNARDVMGLPEDMVVNEFWGIYVRNDRLKMHALAQYDVMNRLFRFAQYNIYDGGSDILTRSTRQGYTDIFCSGTLLRDFRHMIEVRKTLIENSRFVTENAIHYQEQFIIKLREDCDRQVKTLEHEIAQLESMV